MQITATPNDSLSARGWLALALLLLAGVILIGLTAQRFGLLPGAFGAAPSGGLQISTTGLTFDTATLQLPAGEPLTLALVNEELLPHSFDIDDLDIHLEMPMGRSVTVALDGLPAGTYTFYCAVPGHRAAGMEGTLVVK